MKTCDRCDKESTTFTCSFFNEEMICMECKEKERNHPSFEEARMKERSEVLKGNMNYKGIGLPEDLRV